MKITNRGLPTLIVTFLATPVLAQVDNLTRQPRELEQIIVTAQRREEKLQDVPISITVLGGDALDSSRVEGLTETLRRIPGMAAPIGALGTPNISIRGVAAPGLAGAGSSTAAYYLDSTPYGFVRNALAPNADLYDLDRIEVLRGPQGTLFGANAQSGVVRILTHDPVLSGFEAKSRASISSTESGGANYRADLAVNVPIVDEKLAARAVVGYQNRSGWIDKPGNPNADDARISNARLKIKAQPTEKLSLVGSGWFMRYRADAQSIGNDDGENIVAIDEPVHSDTDNFSLKVGYDFSAFALTSATSYQEYKIKSSLWLGVTGNPQIQTTAFSSDVFSQEVILNSQGEGPWKWSVGGSYRDVKDRRSAVVGSTTSTDFNDFSKSWASFGELTRVLFDGRVELTGGLRYFEDEQRLRENISSSGNPATPLVNIPSKYHSLTPRVVLTAHPREDFTVYASYAQGFRSGVSQNPQILFQVPGAPPARPDRLHNYEIGAKGDLFDGRVIFDSAVFFLDWKDVQQNLNEFYQTPAGRLELSSILNGPSASGVGAEFGVTVLPVDGLDLSGTIGWNDLTFDEDVFSGTTRRFAKGTRLGSSPEYTAGASASYSFPLGADLEGRLTTSANYTSKIENNTLSGGINRPGDDGRSILLVDASFVVSAAHHWAATLFADNITNDTDASVRYIGIPGDTWNGLNTRPRTYGAQVEYSF